MMVTIVIPNFNGRNLLDTCLKSIYKQNYKHFCIVVVDNNSTDNSIEYLKQYHHNVKIIKLNDNYGFSKAVNIGITESNTEYTVLLNNDVEVEPYWLEELVKCISSDEMIFSCSSKMIKNSQRDIIDDAGDGLSIFGLPFKCGEHLPAKKFYNKNKVILSSCAGAAIYRRVLFDEIGYFDESFYAYLEDVDIGVRAILSGYKNVFCASAVVYHIGSATSGSMLNGFKVYHTSRNIKLLIEKNFSCFMKTVNYPFILIGSLFLNTFYKKKRIF